VKRGKGAKKSWDGIGMYFHASRNEKRVVSQGGSGMETHACGKKGRRRPGEKKEVQRKES